MVPWLQLGRSRSQVPARPVLQKKMEVFAWFFQQGAENSAGLQQGAGLCCLC